MESTEFEAAAHDAVLAEPSNAELAAYLTLPTGSVQARRRLLSPPDAARLALDLAVMGD